VAGEDAEFAGATLTRINVSVIIPAFNHARFLGAAIESALQQTHCPEEVIVVDDGSTDATQQVLDGYANVIRTIRQPNRGVASARNTGAACALGDVFAFLDADDAWLPGKLESQLAALENRPEVGLVHCGVQEIDVEGRTLTENTHGLEGNTFIDLLLLRDFILGGGSAAMIPRCAFERAGGFDRELSTSADWDLYLRLARDWQVAFVAKPLVRYRQHPRGLHRNVYATRDDMFCALGKAFGGSAKTEVLPLRRLAHAQLHVFLAGAFFSAGALRAFAWHATAAVVLSPSSIRRFLGMGRKRLARRRPARECYAWP
jgi:glycosyltransferase involved in cell wall biosynthesis